MFTKYINDLEYKYQQGLGIVTLKRKDNTVLEFKLLGAKIAQLINEHKVTEAEELFLGMYEAVKGQHIK